MDAFRRLGLHTRWTVSLLAATLVSLTVTFVAGYLTHLSLIEAVGWIDHTNEVKLAIDDCQFALTRADVEGLKQATANVGRLTVDNPRQQQNVARVTLLAERAERLMLADLFASMQREEDRLMTERVQRATSARTRSAAVFKVAALLTFVLGIGSFAILRARRRELEHHQALLEAIIESVDEGVIALDASGEILAMNAEARSYWGASSPRDRWPKDWRAVLHATLEDGSQMTPEQGPLARALRGETCEDVVYRVTPASEPTSSKAGVWVSASARPIRSRLGRIVAAVSTLRNITAERANAERLRDESLTDELTKLLNRRGFLSMATARIETARHAKTPLALLYADINGLKLINDGLGHEQGDRAIQDAANVLRSVFREGDIIARIGGDEFVALLPNFAASARDPLLDRLARAIRSNVEREQRHYRLSMSADITYMDWDASPSVEALLSDADRKMYQRKRERASQSQPYVRAIHPIGRSGAN